MEASTPYVKIYYKQFIYPGIMQITGLVSIEGSTICMKQIINDITFQSLESS